MELRMTLKEADCLEIMRRHERKEITLLKASEEKGHPKNKQNEFGRNTRKSEQKIV